MHLRQSEEEQLALFGRTMDGLRNRRHDPPSPDERCSYILCRDDLFCWRWNCRFCLFYDQFPNGNCQ
ncbi:hypothetical protein I7I53_10982 [Histoplasma capsulatum var. duboisii H88]|uniref:Uncharacterized protein n=1 Tax=Ajellomyces capsulatus (strain H88) TaxID=544711 RepID=A0A8A1LEA7_AJEC8|nr:hypothetical protein I7I53_10982 [Histoplasma capsulatum var. duboisii H88]